MKRVKELDFFKNIQQIREFDFGIFYYFDGLVISEMKEGIHFNWEKAKKAILATKSFYDENEPIIYISNRINSYTVTPADWIKFYQNRYHLDHYAVVGQAKGRISSLLVERTFFKNSIEQFTDLEDAIQWGLKKIESLKKSRGLVVFA